MRIDYEQTMRQAAKIREIGEDVKNLTGRIKNLSEEIPTHWTGRASKAYLVACDALSTKMKKTAQGIVDVAQNIENVANQIYQEDQRQARSVKERSGGGGGGTGW